jgi:hypothetical protein
VLLHAMLAERAWAHAQQINDEIVLAGEAGRPTERLVIHRRARLARAVKAAEQLVALVKDKVTPATRAECEAYLLALRGALASAQHRWQAAARCFARARHIHAQLRALPGGRTDAAAAIDATLATQLEYASHRVLQLGAKAAAVAGAQEDGDASADDAADVDALLAQARASAAEQQQAAATALRYKGEPLVLQSERVLEALRVALEAETHALSAAKAVAAGSQASASDADDALVAAHVSLMNVTRDELRRIVGDASKQPQVEQLALLRRAIGERMQRRTLARLALQYDGAAESDVRVRTIAPLCASATSAAVELGSLVGGSAAAGSVDDAKLDRRTIALSKATASQWRAARAHALARQRQRGGDFAAAGALLERAALLVADARRELASALAVAPPDWADAAERGAPSVDSGLANADRLSRLHVDVMSLLDMVKAQAFVASGASGIDAGGSSTDVLSPSASFDSGAARARSGELASLRGPLQPIAVKPILFELAGGGVQFDSLASRTRKQGAGGWLGSLFGR